MNFSKILKNSVYLFLARIISAIFSFLLIIFIARTNIEFLGKFSLVYAFFLIFTEIPLLGLNLFLVREVAKESHNFKSFFFIGIVLSYVSVVILSIVLFSVILFSGYPKDVNIALLWVLAALIPSGLIAAAQAFFLAFEKISKMSHLTIVENAIRSLGALILIYKGAGIIEIFILFFILRILAALAIMIIMKQDEIVPHSFVWDKNLFIFTLRHWPVFLSIYVLGILMSRIDYLMLSKLGSIRDVGFYSAAYKFLDTLLMAMTALSFALFPVFSRSSLPQEAKELVSTLLKYVSIATFPVLAFFFFLANPIITIFYGKQLLFSGLLLSILIWNLLITGCDQIVGVLLISQNRQNADLKMLIWAFILYVTTLIILIPKFSAVGAAIATIISSAFLLLLKLLYLRKNMKLNLSGFNRNIFLGVSVIFVLWRFSNFVPLNPFLIWCVFLLIYIAALFALKIITPKENKLIFNTVGGLVNFNKQ